MRIPPDLVRDARLFACCDDDTDAVCWVLRDYGQLVAQLRAVRRDLSTFGIDQQGFDDRLEELQQACRSILEL